MPWRSVVGGVLVEQEFPNAIIIRGAFAPLGTQHFVDKYGPPHLTVMQFKMPRVTLTSRDPIELVVLV